ncbi:NAD(P)-binding protein [Pholiota conissans]|uniref:NAD(P)-binding protein n=1 Tax=Pholiota conissans TaxID=109636 RepID=A0A9P5ZGN5_9AGAR|nr:NAD(P)-binding protein [Pholiota conissans]
MKLSFLKVAWGQLTLSVPSVVKENLEGKTVVVTGANIGLGFEAAKHFARMGAGKIIIACRSKKKGDEAVAKIKVDTGNKNVELYLLDLASFASVKAFAERFTKENDRLDILVENAAVATSKFELTEDGWETSLQVNDISPSLLALRLLPLMVETAKTHRTTPRIVVVSSETHYWTSFAKEVIDSPNPLRLLGAEKESAKHMKTRYEDTKLLNVFFVRALNERLVHKSVVVNAPNPGFCYSGLRRNFSGIVVTPLVWLMEVILARTTEEGSRQLVFAAIGNEGKDEMRGAYISMSEVNEPSDFVISEEGRVAQDKLWDNLIDELIKIDPKVRDIVREYLK